MASRGKSVAALQEEDEDEELQGFGFRFLLNSDFVFSVWCLKLF
jgi:hypothetical protein